MSEQTTFVGPERAAEKMARARAIPGMSDRIAAIRADMAEADRVYAENLAAIRRAADLTQVALAEQMGVAQTVVSRLERQHDMLLSTLRSYLKAAGDHPRVVVTINGRDVELDLDSLVKGP
jgi:DNA-binding transcriptional regulator YiaG